MIALSSFRLVVTRELREAFRRKAVWLAAGLLFLASTAVVVVPDLVNDNDTPTYKVLIVGDAPRIEGALDRLQAPLGARIVVTHTSDEATAERLVLADEVDVGVVPGDVSRIVVPAGEHDRLVGAVRQALGQDSLAQRLEEAGLSAGEISELFSVPSPQVQELDEESQSRRGAAFALALVLYVLLLSLMIQVANGTAVEKANRISEVLLPIVRPGALMFGKVVGVGLVGLTTLLAAMVPPVVKLIAGGDLPEGIGGALIGGALWLGGGLALFLTIAAALGALVERQEDAGSVVTPFTAMLIGTFIVAQSAPESPVAAVLAYIPLTSPILIPTRLAVGASSPVEIVLSAVFLLGAIWFVGRIGTVIYARAIVRTGRRLKLREVLG